MINKFKEAMKFDSLLIEYKVLLKVDMSTAAELFTIMFTSLIESYLSVEEDVKRAVDKLHNTLISDKSTRLNNLAKYHNGYLPDANIRMAMVELMKPVIVSKRVVTVSDKVTDKAYWEYTEEDLMLVDDPARLESIINNYGSAKTKDSIIATAKARYGLSAEEHKANIDKLRTFARARQKELRAAAPKISESLQSKLDKGTKTSLTAKEVEELRKLLG